MHTLGAQRIGVATGDLVRHYRDRNFVDTVWVTEGIKPGVIAMSHHLGRWRLEENVGVNPGMSSTAQLDEEAQGAFRLNILHGARPWQSFDPDTAHLVGRCGRAPEPDPCRPPRTR